MIPESIFQKKIKPSLDTVLKMNVKKHDTVSLSNFPSNVQFCNLRT